jgi:hypothetical protein
MPFFVGDRPRGNEQSDLMFTEVTGYYRLIVLLIRLKEDCVIPRYEAR